jgi:hypothetical protein
LPSSPSAQFPRQSFDSTFRARVRSSVAPLLQRFAGLVLSSLSYAFFSMKAVLGTLSQLFPAIILELDFPIQVNDYSMMQ